MDKKFIVENYQPMLEHFKRLVDPDMKHGPEKYIEYYGQYYWEKLLLIECADLKPHSECLDISTGVGLLPLMLRSQGHSCDATEAVGEYNTDSKDNTEAYALYRKMNGVDTTEFSILRNGTWRGELPNKKYDVIFSSRIVWDRGFGVEQYHRLFDYLFEHTDRLVLNFNHYWHPDTAPKKPHLQWLYKHAADIQNVTGMNCVFDKYTYQKEESQ